jgi:membrane-anchored protein YejM (alkaline phosphatase superfamily)
MSSAPYRTLRSWLSARAQSYLAVITALSLSVPVLYLALTRYLEGVDPTSLAGFYATLAIVGYYVILLQLVTTAVFLVFSFSTRAATVACAIVLAASLFYLFLDGTVYRVYRFHVDAFWLRYTLTSFSGIGVSARMVAAAAAVFVGVVAMVALLVRIAPRLPARRSIAAGTGLVAIAAFAASQAIHVVAYEKNDTRFTQLTPRLPFYYPIHSHRNAVKYGGLLPMIVETPAPTLGDASSSSLVYPLHEVSCASSRRPNIVLLLLESWRFDAMDEVVSPRMYRFAQRASVFENHFSSGNSTPSGVFSVFYGIHPTYWAAVKANAATIDNPVLIDALAANDYAFGIFADSHFERHKIKDTIFRGIDVQEEFAGRTPDANDRDLTNRLYEFAAASKAKGQPFFAFAFYKSTHFSYYYPPDSTLFTPTAKLNVALAGGRRDPTRYLNDYRNAVHYVDGLIGDLLDRMEAAGMMDNTIVLITSDHGEEFDDNGENYWGHTSNFTGYQTRVPMILYVPWREPRRVDAVTAHVDIPPTLLVEGLGCARNVRDYSNGVNLLAEIPRERPLVVASYVNHAIVLGEDVLVVYPMYVQHHRLWDIEAKAGSPPAEMALRVMDEMNRFHRGEESSSGPRSARSAFP